MESKKKEIEEGIKNFLSEETIEAVDGKQARPDAAEPEPATETGTPANHINCIYTTETKTKRVQLLIQPSVYTKAKGIAARNGLSLNEYIIQATMAFNNENSEI